MWPRLASERTLLLCQLHRRSIYRHVTALLTVCNSILISQASPCLLNEIQSLARELGCPIPAALLRSITPHPSSSSVSSFPQLLSVLSLSKLLPASGSLFPQLGVCSRSPGQLCIFLMCSGPGGSWTLATHTPQSCNPFLRLCHSNCQYCILHGRECPGVTQGVVGTSWGVPHLAVPSVVTDVLTDDIIGERHVYLMKALEVLLTCTKPRGYRLSKLWMTLIKTLHRFRQSGGGRGRSLGRWAGEAGRTV